MMEAFLMMLARRELLLGSLALPALAAQKKKAAPPPPNIVLIVAEDVPAFLLGCYGNTDVQTPNLDLLAKGGARFANHLVYSPIADPSRATLYTGRLPRQHGIQDVVTTPSSAFQSEILISDVLAAQGYNCGYAGKWNLGNDSTPQHHCNFWNTAPEQATAFLDQQSATKPFFLTVSYPRVDDDAASKYLDLYANSTFERMGREPAASSATEKDKLKDVVANLRKRAAAATALDARIPALLAKLHDRGLNGNTLIVFCSTNGALLGRHGLWGDGRASEPVNMYEEAVHVPMIWNWVGAIPVESVRNEVVASYDLMQSLCEVAGAEPPQGRGLVGRGYSRLALGKPFPKKQPWRSVVFGAYRNAAMARDTRFKLVLRNQGKGPNDMYDLTLDPRERVNQASNPGFISTREQLTRQLAAFEKAG